MKYFSRAVIHSFATTLLLAIAGPVVAQETLDCAALATSQFAEPAGYASQCTSEAAQQPANIPLRPNAPSDTGYSYNMRGVAGSAQGLYSFTLSAFGTQTTVGDPGPTFYSWDFDPTGTTLYAIQTPAAAASSFGTVNTATAAFTPLFPVTGLSGADTPSGMSIDPVTGDAFLSSATNLYSFNLATGAATLIGAFGTTLMIEIAIKCDGAMYGHDIGTDSLYSINRATGAATLIGAHGLLANFAQGMDFDNNDGTLYAAIYTGGGTYTYGSFNLTTGAVTPLNTNTPSGEWELAIPTTCGPVVPPTETEPNDTKAQANVIQLPGTNKVGVITGNSISASGSGIDTFLVKSAAQAAGFYRHRLLVTSATAGHTISIRGLAQSGGVITPGGDSAVQTSSASTTPARFVQWYTSGATADIYVRVTGVAGTTSDYQLNYEVEAVVPVNGPVGVPPGPLTISTVGQSTVDTDLWVYNGARSAILDFGNDDQFGTTAAQSIVTRTVDPGVYYVAVTNYNFANSLASPADDDFRSGLVLDFAGALANSSTSTTDVDLDLLVGATPVTVSRAGPFDIKFVRFIAGTYELEPNDNKANANTLLLPPADATAVSSGNSTSATGAGLDYIRVTTAIQTTAGYYRHRLIVTSDTPGHTLTIRGLTQTGGVVNAGTDSALQTSSASTTPARFIQWYTSEVPADIYISVAGTAATTSDYSLAYTVEAVVPTAGPSVTTQPVTITTVGQTSTDTDMWVYDGSRMAIPDYGNDDQFNTSALQSELIRSYGDGTYTLAVTSYNFANNLPSPADDDFRTGTVLDFPGALINTSTTLNVPVNVSIGGVVVPLVRAGAFDVAFVNFSASGDTIFADGFD